MLNHCCNDLYLLKGITRSILILLLVLAFQSAYSQKNSEPQPNKEYSETILIADKYLLTGDYIKAWDEYEKAWNLYQRQTYPESKIDQISKTLANTPLSAMLYDKAIKRGDSCFSAKDYKSANSEYFNALRLDPSAQYPEKKLNEVSSVFVDPENETRFRIVLIHANKALGRARYDKAISYYQQALLIKPSENWIEKKIEEISTLKTEYLSGMDPYTRCIAESDNLMELKKWAEARDSFAKALAIRPKENYPAAKIVLLDHLPELNKSGEKTYSTLIEDADKFYKFQDYENAAIHFQEAHDLKPDEAYPKIMLKKLGHLNDDSEGISQKYASAVINADILSLAGDTKAAMIGYKRCIAKQPGDMYVKSRIAELNAVSNTTSESSTAYQLAIAKGERSTASSNYSKALSEFRYASMLKPSETYPKEKIEAIQNLIQLEKAKEIAAKEAQTKPVVTQAETKEPVVRTKTEPGTEFSADADNQQKNNSLIIARLAQKPKQENTVKEPVIADKSYDKKANTKTTDGNLTAFESKPDKSKPGKNPNLVESQPTQAGIKSETGKTITATTAKSPYENQNPVMPATFKSGAVSITGKKEEIAVSENQKNEQFKTAATASSETNDNLVKKTEKKADYAVVEPPPTQMTEKKSIPVAQKTQEKPVVIKPVLTEPNASQEKYDNALAFADKAYNEKNYSYALNGYKAALKIKPAEKYPQEKMNAINELRQQENILVDNYKKTILAADKAFSEKDYTKAKTAYQAALNLNPAQKYPQDKIASINVILGQQNARQEKYNLAIANADNAYETKDFVTAMTEYKTAVSISPTENYPKERIESITNIMSRQKVVQENYSKAVMAAEKAFAAKDYSASINAFQSAIEFKPDENYPQERITAINSLLALDKEKRDKQYSDYLGKADDYYSKKDFPVAQKEYKMASEIKPDEEYPRERLKQISDILIARAKETKAAYEGAIADADKAYKALIYDQAVLFYSKALEIKPGEIYPGQMIARIRKNMKDHALVDITTGNFILKNDSEKRFSFTPVNAAMRKNNYLVVRARISGKSQPKLYINYGRETSKNGGVVVKNINSEMLNDFVINISIQDKWFREDNNWLSLYSENGDLEVASVRISQGR